MEFEHMDPQLFLPAGPEDTGGDILADSPKSSYFRDALTRFRKNRSSVAAAVILGLLFAFAMLGPLLSRYELSDRDGYYKNVLPKFQPLAFLGWDGCATVEGGQATYDYYSGIGKEYGGSAVKHWQPLAEAGRYRMQVDTYEKVGFIYADLTWEQYADLLRYQDQTGQQVLFPLPERYATGSLAVASGANLWYELADDGPFTAGASAHHDETGQPVYVADYLTRSPLAVDYDSLRLSGDDGSWIYAVKNQTGCRVRLLYSRYYRYLHGFDASHPFGTNQHGQDLFVCLAVGARLSFLLAIGVGLINLLIGITYGAVEGFYGGKTDLILERIADILTAVPFIVVATLFQLHFAKSAGPVLSLLFAFVLTGWIGIASRVRTQFYRFRGAEYVLAARTLGAKDRRLIFRHILPNCVGTIITGTILLIPGVIFSESMLSYLGIVNLESSNLTSIGTMLSGGRQYLGSYPHILAFPAVFLALLEISFNLFGNGARDALNPSLRGAEEL